MTDRAREIAELVSAHPSVVRLVGGPFNAIATYLPGERLVGVYLGDPGEPVELGVVLRLDRPLPPVLADLRAQVSAVCGGVPVDITVADVELPAELVAP